jgi:Mg2+/Co2+ transporter CorB
MLESIIDLYDRDVSEVMVHRKNMETLDAEQPPAAIIEAVINSTHTRLPLWKENSDNIVGVLHAKTCYALSVPQAMTRRKWTYRR